MALEDRALLSTLTVSNTSDSSPGSLRAAINQANSSGGTATIIFSSLFHTAQTITLTGGLLDLTGTHGTTTIQGPGAGLLSVSGNQASQVFQVEHGVTAWISGLTIIGGHSQKSRGGLVNYGTATLTDCTVSGNTAGAGGGLMNFVGTTTLTDCTISGNTADSGGGLFNYGSLATSAAPP
jgi:hypothetical protein